MPYLSAFKQFYDLLLLIVLYLSLYRPVRESLPIVLLLGLVMDNLSGSSFGLFVTVYFWIFVIVSWGTKYLHVGSRILVLTVVAAGVLIENFLFLGSIVLLGKGSQLPKGVFDNVGVQAFWAIFTGPVFLILIRYLHKRFEDRFNELMNTWNEQRG
jgi:cell shape-determining protein MreD